MEVFLIVLTLAVLIGIYVMVVSKWKTLITATGVESEDLHAKYAYLKEQNIRCKLRSESSMGMGVTPGLNPESSSITKLLVKEQDIKPALDLLDQYEQQEARIY
jgi:hypothetical protein